MRVDITPIVRHAENLIESITAKSRSRASSDAHKLLLRFPDPTWAETAPGCTIWYNNEQELAQAIEALRYVALTWLRALISPDRDWEPTAEWPQPDNLIEAIRELAKYTPNPTEPPRTQSDLPRESSECVNLEEDSPVPVIV